jgi:hypothetical protein
MKEKDKHLGTILVFVIVLTILFLIYKNVKLLYAALVLGAIALLIPALSRKIHIVWMKFAELLGLVMNKVILGLVFFYIPGTGSIAEQGFQKKSPQNKTRNKKLFHRKELHLHQKKSRAIVVNSEPLNLLLWTTRVFPAAISYPRLVFQVLPR